MINPFSCPASAKLWPSFSDDRMVPVRELGTKHLISLGRITSEWVDRYYGDVALRIWACEWLVVFTEELEKRNG